MSSGNGQGDYPDWWPSGVDEHYVRECNCDWCGEVAKRLDEWRNGLAPDGEHASLDSFA